MHRPMQVLWRHIWKHTVEKSQTNATSVIMHPLRQAIWGHIWERTAEKSQTNATSVTMHPLRQVVWGDIWEHTVEKKTILLKVQPVWICLFWSKQLEETFEDTQWRKVKQMQPMWLCIFSGSQFEGPSEETQLQFGDNLNIFVNIWMYTISVCVWHKLYQFIEISPRSKFIWHCTHPGTI